MSNRWTSPGDQRLAGPNKTARTKIRKAVDKLIRAEVTFSWSGAQTTEDKVRITRELKEARDYLTRVLREVLPMKIELTKEQLREAVGEYMITASYEDFMGLVKAYHTAHLHTVDHTKFAADHAKMIEKLCSLPSGTIRRML